MSRAVFRRFPSIHPQPALRPFIRILMGLSLVVLGVPYRLGATSEPVISDRPSAAPRAGAVGPPVVATLVQTVDTSQWSPPSPDPSGIVYLPAAAALLVTDSEVDEMPIFAGVNLFQASLTGQVEETLSTLPFSSEPTDVTVNPLNGHLFFTDDVLDKIFELDPGPDGEYRTGDDGITSFGTRAFGSHDPEGVTFDVQHRALFVADGISDSVYELLPGDNGVFDGPPPAGDDQVRSFDTVSLGLTDPEGITYNPFNGHLYLIGMPEEIVVELTRAGELVQLIDLSAARPKTPTGLVFAPGSQGELSLYVTDLQVDNNVDPNENDGKLFEFSIPGVIIPPGQLVRLPLLLR